MEVEVIYKGFQCERCGHKWVPHNIKNPPVICPGCGSAYWNRPKVQRIKSKK